MDATTDEKELVRKLVFTGHLNVPERKALPGRRVKGSLIRAVVAEALWSGRPFRAWWMPEDSMIGCVIEFRGDGPGRVAWTYDGIEGKQAGTREHPSTEAAAEALVLEARQLLGDAIDGVPVDWAV